jgi:sugar/nucleoside kinase (ribokinase family)
LGSAFDLPGMDKNNGIATLLERARKQGLFTVLDLTTDLTPAHLEILKPALPWISLFMPSRGEALGLTGKTDPAEAAAVFLSMGCGAVVIKLGADGCMVLSDGNCITLPAYPAEVVDTTGAGDAFVSAFIAGRVKGLPLETCARLGNAAGSVCVSAIGANGALKNFEQLEKII